MVNTGIEGWLPKERLVTMDKFLGDTTENKPISLKPKISLPPLPTYPPIPKPTEENYKLDMTPKEQDDYIKKELQNDDNFPTDLPEIKDNIGKSHLMNPRTYAEFHQATPLLKAYADKGCPVECGPDWTREKILLLLNHGPHQSSKRRDAVKQLRHETKEKIKCGYARVIKWGDIKDNLPKKLKISPVAMIPHKSKKYRCILDLSFTLFSNGISHSSVNETTTRKAKPEAMAQLGNCLKRIVATMADNFDMQKPFMFSKLDIKDGFWRMRVSDDDAWNFAYVLPSLQTSSNIDDIELVVPNSLQMGWCESPPFFCAGSETARDVIEIIADNPTLESHRFEHTMLTELVNDSIPPTIGNSQLLEVFVNDFICCTNNTSETNLTQTSRAMIHGIHSIFPPPEIRGHPGGDPISEKKLDNGEGVWSFKKEILGWDFDGEEFTMQLPPKKCKVIIALIRKMRKLQRPSLNKYERLVGKLQHASFGLPCGRALFSPLQQAMRHNPPFVPLTSELKQILEDWEYIINFMKNHPTSVLQLLYNYPDYIGHSDACALGAGGTWSSGLKEILKPFLWQVQWPDDIRNALITEQNPTGTITINDLELAGLLLNWLALECQKEIHLAYHHVGTFCDNTSAVSWTYKMRTSKSMIAGRLLRMLGLRIHARQASSLIPIHIAGEENIQADIVSRAFKDGKFFKAKTSLTSYFNLHFPLQQDVSWTEFQLPKNLVARVISCLRGELLPMASLRRLPGIVTSTGTTGADMHPYSDATPSSLKNLHLTEIKLSADTPPECAQGPTVEAKLSKFKHSRTLSRPSTRPSNWLDNELRSTGRIKNTTSP